MIRIVLIAIFLCLGSKGFCQSQIIIKTIPLTLLRPNTPMISFALEYRKNQIGFEYEHGIETGYIVGYGDNFRDTFRLQKNYFRSQFNFRYYLKDKRSLFGLNFSFLPSTYTRRNDWYETNETKFTYSLSNISRNQLDYRFIYGIVLPTNSPFSFEFLTGCGARLVRVNHDAIAAILNEDEIVMGGWFIPSDRYEGVNLNLSFLISIRIAYNLFQSKTDTN